MQKFCGIMSTAGTIPENTIRGGSSVEYLTMQKFYGTMSTAGTIPENAIRCGSSMEQCMMRKFYGTMHDAEVLWNKEKKNTPETGENAEGERRFLVFWDCTKGVKGSLDQEKRK